LMASMGIELDAPTAVSGGGGEGAGRKVGSELGVGGEGVCGGGGGSALDGMQGGNLSYHRHGCRRSCSRGKGGNKVGCVCGGGGGKRVCSGMQTGVALAPQVHATRLVSPCIGASYLKPSQVSVMYAPDLHERTHLHPQTPHHQCPAASSLGHLTAAAAGDTTHVMLKLYCHFYMVQDIPRELPM
jgi:hypothetical protein